MKRKKKEIIHQMKVLEKSISEETNIKNEEIRRMIFQAISNARQHGLEVEAGTRNPASGDCAFESAILNNNDRPCFK